MSTSRANPNENSECVVTAATGNELESMGDTNGPSGSLILNDPNIIFVADSTHSSDKSRLFSGPQGIFTHAGFKVFVELWDSDSQQLDNIKVEDNAEKLYVAMMRIMHLQSAQRTILDSYMVRCCHASFYTAFENVQSSYEDHLDRDTQQATLSIDRKIGQLLKMGRITNATEQEQYGEGLRRLVSHGRISSILVRTFGLGVIALMPRSLHDSALDDVDHEVLEHMATFIANKNPDTVELCQRLEDDYMSLVRNHDSLFGFDPRHDSGLQNLLARVVDWMTTFCFQDQISLGLEMSEIRKARNGSARSSSCGSGSNNTVFNTIGHHDKARFQKIPSSYNSISVNEDTMGSYEEISNSAGGIQASQDIYKGPTVGHPRKSRSKGSFNKREYNDCAEPTDQGFTSSEKIDFHPTTHLLARPDATLIDREDLSDSLLNEHDYDNGRPLEGFLFREATSVLEKQVNGGEAETISLAFPSNLGHLEDESVSLSYGSHASEHLSRNFDPSVSRDLSVCPLSSIDLSTTQDSDVEVDTRDHQTRATPTVDMPSPSRQRIIHSASIIEISSASVSESEDDYPMHVSSHEPVDVSDFDHNNEESTERSPVYENLGTPGAFSPIVSPSRDEHQSSEDSDPPKRYPQRRRIIRRRSDSVGKVSRSPKIPSQILKTVEDQLSPAETSDSDAPLVRPFRRHRQSSSPSVTTVENDVSQACAAINSMEPRDTLECLHSVKVPTLQNGKLIWPIPYPKASTSVVGRPFHPIPPIKQVTRSGQVILNGVTANSRPKSSFGLKDIIGKEKPSAFSIKNIMPSAPQKKVPLSGGAKNLENFYDALRHCFAPVIVGPDFIQHGSVKKRKFSLIDVAGRRPREPRFTVEYAIEQHLAKQGHQEHITPNTSNKLKVGLDGVDEVPQSSSCNATEAGEDVTMEPNTDCAVKNEDLSSSTDEADAEEKAASQQGELRNIGVTAASKPVISEHGPNAMYGNRRHGSVQREKPTDRDERVHSIEDKRDQKTLRDRQEALFGNEGPEAIAERGQKGLNGLVETQCRRQE